MPHAPLSGKKALITGASRGIGAAMARSLGGAGVLVAVHYSAQRESADEVVAHIESAGGHAFVVQADLRSVAAIEQMFEVLDREFTARTGERSFDFLINNAGAGDWMAFDKVSEAVFDEVSDLIFKGTFFVSQYAIPRLIDGGRVVNTSSCSTRSAQPYVAVYAAAKAAVNYLTLAFAQALGPRKITVNALSPGSTATDLIKDLRAHPGFDAAAIKNTALGRLGEPQDIADALLLLLSPQSGWITGNVIDVSGGLHL